MRDDPGPGETEHEFLAHIEFKIGDFIHHLGQTFARRVVQQDFFCPGKGAVSHRNIDVKGKIRQHAEDDRLSGQDMAAKGAGHVNAAQLLESNPHLFKAFYRVADSRDRQSGGCVWGTPLPNGPSITITVPSPPKMTRSMVL